MSARTDPMYYDITIEETKTKKLKSAQVACWWSGDASINGLRAMCDCQLGGYFHATSRTIRENGRSIDSWSGSWASAHFDYQKSNKCDHKPSRKFKPVRATLPDGKIIQLAA